MKNSQYVPPDSLRASTYGCSMQIWGEAIQQLSKLTISRVFTESKRKYPVLNKGLPNPNSVFL